MISNELIMPEFDIFDLQGKEYHRWVFDVVNTFIGKRLSNTIQPIGLNIIPPSKESKAQTLMFLRRHIHSTLKKQYLKKIAPLNLWDALKQRFNNMHDAQLPESTTRWEALQLMDFPKIQDYNQAILDLQSKLSFCGMEKSENEMIEKSLNTFPTSISSLAHQYWLEYEQGRILTFNDLINNLAKKKRHHEIILNNNSRPASTKKPESNQAERKTRKDKNNVCSKPYNRGGQGPRSGRGGRGRGRGRSQNLTWHRDQNTNSNKNQSGSANDGKMHSNFGKFTCYWCYSTKHKHKQCRASKEIMIIYKKHKQYLAQEFNFAGEFEMNADTNLIIALDKETNLVILDFEYPM